MPKKKETKAPKQPASSEKDEEKRLLEEHPYETESQIQNRYGKGRGKNGSEGSGNKADRLNH